MIKQHSGLRGCLYSKTALWVIRKVAVIGRCLLLKGSIQSKTALCEIRKVTDTGEVAVVERLGK